MGLFQDILAFNNAGRAANAVSDSNIAAEHGVLDATANGQQGITNALGQGRNDLTAARDTAVSGVNTATQGANSTLHDVLMSQTANLDPYLGAGQQGATDLATYAKDGGPKFSFNYDDYKNSDAYKFQLDQGTQAINNSASASGLGNSGATLKALTNYGQGLASTYYQQAFQNAQSQFQTNQNTTLANLGALINTGQNATSQYNAATSNYGNTAAQNNINAGVYGGNTNMTVAQLLSQQGLQGSEFSGALGEQGAKTAGDFAVGAGEAHAGGILSQGDILNKGISDLAGLATSFLP